MSNNRTINDFWVVIAAYNESKVIRNVVGNVVSRCPNVVVIDDGSSDGTYAELLETDAWVIQHPINLGQGAALQTGISFALKKGAKQIATFDADGQHSVDDLLAMYELICTRDIDAVLGSRFFGASGEYFFIQKIFPESRCFLYRNN